MRGITDIIISAASGAAAGYITNSAAVSMLFKKYFGRWGGVVERYYDEFIDGICALVEKDLLKEDALRREFSKSGFHAALSHIVRELLQNEIPARVSGITFADIQGIEESAENLVLRIEQYEGAVIYSILNVFAKNKLNIPLSSAQRSHFIEHIKILYTQKKEEITNDVRAALAMFLKGRSIKDFIYKDGIDIFKKNVYSVYKTIPFCAYEEKIDAFAKNYIAATAPALKFSGLREALNAAPLSVFGNMPQKITEALLCGAASYAQTKEGRDNFIYAMQAVYNALKACKTPLMPHFEGAAEKINSIAAKEIPTAMNDAAALVHKNKNEAESLINEAIDEELQKNTWGAVLQSLKNSFTGNFAREYNIVSEIEDAIADSGQKIVLDVQNKINEFVSRKTTDECITLLEKNGIVNEEKTAAYTAAYIEALIVDRSKTNISFSGAALKTPLSQFVNINIQDVPKRIAPAIYAFIKKTFLNTGAKPCAAGAEAIPPEEKKAGIDTAIKENGFSFLAGIFRDGGAFIKWRSFWQKYKHTKIEYITNSLVSDRITEKAADGVWSLLNTNIERIVQGNVSKLVRARLGGCTPAQINELAQNFIGRELRPINIFGALLGGIAGILCAVLTAAFNAQNAHPAVLLPIYCVIFAGVGIATNALAVRMLFRPYKKIIFNFPPFVGAAVRRKKEFAKSIAVFVRDGVLSPEYLNRIFTDNIDAMRDGALCLLRENNYMRLNLFLRDADVQQKITGFIFDALRRTAVKAPALAEYAAGKIKSAAENGSLKHFAKNAADFTAKKLRAGNLPEGVYSFIHNYCGSQNTDALLKIIFPFARPFLIDLYCRTINNLSGGTIENLARRHYKKFIQTAAPLSSLLPENAEEKTASFILEKIPDAAKHALPDILRGIIKKKLSGQTTLLDIIGKDFFKKHEDEFFAFVIRALNGRRHIITERILSGMNFAVRAAVGGCIPGIVNTVINRKLPLFLRSKRGEIEVIVQKALSKNLAGWGLDNFEDGAWTPVFDALSVLLAKVLEKDEVRSAFKIPLAGIIKSYTGLSVKSVCGLCGIDSIDAALDIARPFLPFFAADLQKALRGEEAGAALADGIYGVLAPADVKIQNLLDGIDIKKVISAFFDEFSKNDNFINFVQNIIEKYAAIILSNSEFINFDILKDDVQDFVSHIADDCRDDIEKALSPYISIFIEHLSSDISKETKDALLIDIFLDAVLETARKNFSGISGAVDIQSIIENEINEMHPQEIEKLFYKFAGRYFVKIILYGWIGAGGGIISALGLILQHHKV
ncbi:MAG: DUF445 family protein [Spirochaetaceae bacterium]|jgi:uncharacterized membrane protein YheB (UPF0754 family)|nr:DUF445 family protein [Spirochaetaceae bacterium]